MERCSTTLDWNEQITLSDSKLLVTRQASSKPLPQTFNTCKFHFIISISTSCSNIGHLAKCLFCYLETCTSLMLEPQSMSRSGCKDKGKQREDRSHVDEEPMAANKKPSISRSQNHESPDHLSLGTSQLPIVP